jgi:hypothetical protein
MRCDRRRRRVAKARQAVTGTVNVPALFARRDEWVTSWTGTAKARPAGLEGLGAELARGQGSWTATGGLPWKPQTGTRWR